MMETILFSFILVLIIIWMMLGILYFYMRYVSPYDFIIKKTERAMKISRRKKQRRKRRTERKRNNRASRVCTDWKKPFHFPDYPTNSLCFII